VGKRTNRLEDTLGEGIYFEVYLFKSWVKAKREFEEKKGERVLVSLEKERR